MSFKQRLFDKVILGYPFLLFLIVVLGLGLILYIRRVDLAVMSLVLVVPILLAGIMLLKPKDLAINPISFTPDCKINFNHLLLINILLFVISLILLLVFSERPLAYFVILAIFAGILFAQIIVKRAPWTDFLILFEITLLSLNLIWGVGLKYPLYFGGTDIMVHFNYIETILNTGHFTSIGEAYRYFPIYHVLNAMGTEVTSLPLKYATLITMGVAWQGANLLGYLIFKQISGSAKLGLLASLVFALSEVQLYYGTYSIARSLDYVFFLGWLYIVMVLSKKDIRYIPFLLIFTAAFILTHHVTALLLLPILIIFYVCQKLFFGLFNETTLLPAKPFILLEISFFAYLVWVASSLFDSEVGGFLSTLFQTETSIRINERVLLGGPVAFLFNSLYYSFVLIFVLIGVGVAWQSGKEISRQNSLRTLALAALLFIILYLPYPLGMLPQAEVTFAQRYPLLVLPFIAIIMAYGIGYFMKKETSSRTKLRYATGVPIFTLVLITIATFFSIVTGLNAQDNHLFPHTANVPSTYFSKAELNSNSFINKKGDPGLTLYSDYYTVRNNYYFNNLTTRRVLMGGDAGYIQEGYILIRISELNTREVLLFSEIGSINSAYRYQIDPARPETNILMNLGSERNIYTNSSVKIFLK